MISKYVAPDRHCLGNHPPTYPTGDKFHLRAYTFFRLEGNKLHCHVQIDDSIGVWFPHAYHSSFEDYLIQDIAELTERSHSRIRNPFVCVPVWRPIKCLQILHSVCMTQSHCLVQSLSSKYFIEQTVICFSSNSDLEHQGYKRAL